MSSKVWNQCDYVGWLYFYESGPPQGCAKYQLVKVAAPTGNYDVGPRLYIRKPFHHLYRLYQHLKNLGKHYLSTFLEEKHHGL